MTQLEALDILKMGENVFLTGPAGSGKTFVLNEYIKYLKDHEVDVGVTASTGIAASHMGGMTIHAWTGLGVRDALTARDLDDLEDKPYLWKRFEKAKVLIIDEISMLHHFRLDLVELLCRKFKRSSEPFGGLQVILCGDFFQLPPIVRNGGRMISAESERAIELGESLFSLPDTEVFPDSGNSFSDSTCHSTFDIRHSPKTAFAYNSPAWKKLSPKICYLEEQHRQSDKVYLKVLNAIRSGMISDDIRAHLNSRKDKTHELGIEPTKLYSHNVNVDVENDRELEKLPGQTFEYGMGTRGRPALADTLKRSCLAPELLRLKKGARVMFVKNNYELDFVNGTLGVVEFCDSSSIAVRIGNGRRIEVPMAGWEIEEDGKVKAEIMQYPLRLAWAITVHKSQGMSLDAAEVDLSRSFEPGMGYVALSRVRSLAGLSLLGLNEMALKVHPEVLDFDNRFSEQSEGDAEELRQMKQTTIVDRQADYLNSIAPAKSGLGKKGKKEKIDTIEKTKELLLSKKTLFEIMSERGLKPGTILDHCEKIKDRHSDFDFSHLIEKMPIVRQKTIRGALVKSGMQGGKYLLNPAKALLGSGVTFDELRLVRLCM